MTPRDVSSTSPRPAWGGQLHTFWKNRLRERPLGFSGGAGTTASEGCFFDLDLNEDARFVWEMDRAMLDSFTRNDERPRLFGGTGGVEDDPCGSCCCSGAAKDILSRLLLRMTGRRKWTRGNPRFYWFCRGHISRSCDNATFIMVYMRQLHDKVLGKLSFSSADGSL